MYINTLITLIMCITTSSHHVRYHTHVHHHIITSCTPSRPPTRPAGYVGMWVSVRANVRACAAAARGGRRALRVCVCGGIFSGVLIVSLSLFGLAAAYTTVRTACPRLHAADVWHTGGGWMDR